MPDETQEGPTNVKPIAQPNTQTNAGNASVQNSGNKVVKTPWTHPVLQGDDENHTEFGFPTITHAQPVELTPEQYDKAKAAARTLRFRLKEVK